MGRTPLGSKMSIFPKINQNADVVTVVFCYFYGEPLKRSVRLTKHWSNTTSYNWKCTRNWVDRMNFWKTSRGHLEWSYVYILKNINAFFTAIWNWKFLIAHPIFQYFETFIAFIILLLLGYFYMFDTTFWYRYCILKVVDNLSKYRHMGQSSSILGM